MRVLIALTCLIAVTLALTEKDYQIHFTKWMQQNKKSYHHEEFKNRYAIFKNNVDFINAKNAENNGMTLEVNKFADLTNEEFNKFFLGVKNTKVIEPETVIPLKDLKVAALPTAYDWNSKGAVTPIKNQEQCGSCWSFSTTGSTEGCHFIKTGSLVGLSEQNLMDCSTAEGNQGCDGGLMTAAMQYIISNKGIDTEASYPYTAEDGTSCNYNAANSGATLKSFVNVKTGDESDLQAKAYVGPTSVAIDASQNSFQFYSSGVYYEPACSSTQLDHGVLVVGWGVDSGKDYWIVKNSWGTDWGLDGFIWMSRNKNNNCGIATMGTLPQC